MGVKIIPTPTPNMPMQAKKSISCHAGGSGIFNQTIACTSTPMPDIDATLAASVCM